MNRKKPFQIPSPHAVFTFLVHLLFWSVVAVGLSALRDHSYLLFHSTVEIFIIVIMFAAFLFAWNCRQFENNYLLILGVASGFVGIIGVLHTLSYKGMGVLPGNTANIATQFWVASRYLFSVSVLAAPLFLRRGISPSVVVLIYASATALLISGVSTGVFPDCFVEGRGLTVFKVWSEYVICLIFSAGLVVLYRNRKEFDPYVLGFLIGSVVLTISAEMVFATYLAVYDNMNFLGHLLLVGSEYLFYKAIVETGVAQPQRLLFRDLKLANDRLSLASAYFRQIAEVVPDMVWTSGADGTLDYCNTRWQDYVGEVQGRPLRWEFFVHEDDLRSLHSLWQRALFSGFFEQEMRIRRFDGTFRWHLNRAKAVCDEEGQIITWFGTCTDIHDLKMIEDDLRHSERLRGDLLATVSHDLKNPLTAITMSAGMIRRFQPAPDKWASVRRFASNIQKAADQMNRLISDQLEIARIEAGNLVLERKFWDLRELVDEAVDVLKPLIDQKGITLEKEYETSTDATEAFIACFDRVRFQQVISNLLGNAIKFSPDKGRIGVRVVCSVAELKFAVTDNGSGITNDQLEHVFDRFWQAKQSDRIGSGLGLWIAKGIVDTHGGRIWVESTAGQGSTFFFILPRRKGEDVVAGLKSAGLRSLDSEVTEKDQCIQVIGS